METDLTNIISLSSPGLCASHLQSLAELESITHSGCRDGSVGKVAVFKTWGPELEPLNVYQRLGAVGEGCTHPQCQHRGGG